MPAMTRTLVSPRFQVRLLAGLVTAVCSAAALADEPAATPDSAPAANPATYTLQEVVVTARKIAEPASKTPLSLTVLGGEDLKDNGVVNISQIGDLAAGVIIGRDGFGVNVNVRGVTTTDTTSKGEQGVAFNVDGITIGRPLVQGLSFFDVDRVEILRGPQGTLYGKSTTGGAINLVTNRPEAKFDASAAIDVGNYNSKRSDAMVNFPVNQDFALRFAVNTNDRDGYLQPADGSTPRNDQHDRAVRLSGLYKFSSDTSLYVAINGATVTGVGYATVPVATVLNNSGAAQRNVFANPFGGNLDDSNHAINGEFTTRLGLATLTYVGGYSDYSAKERTSGTYDPAQNSDPFGNPQYAWRNYVGEFKTTSHELRLSNAEKSVVDWVAGLNYGREDIHESDHNLNAPLSNPTVAASTNGIDPLNETVHTSNGIFGQVTWHAAEQWRITAGLRESNDEVNRVGTFAAGPTPGCGNALADCVGGPNNGHESASKTTYRLGADYLLTPNQMFYGSVATGYKAGGFNDFDPVTHGTGTYAPEQLTAYELGYKGRLSEQVQFNSDLFYYNYARDQISGLENIQGNFVIFTKDVPATIYGWENELKMRLTPDDRLDASLSLERSRYGDFLTGLFGNVQFSGLSLDKTPSVAIALSYTHDWSLESGAGLRAHIGSRYSSGYKLADFVGGVQYSQPSFTRTDLDLTWTDKSDKFFAQFYVKNLEDKVQLLAFESHLDATVSEPRFFGIRLGVKL